MTSVTEIAEPPLPPPSPAMLMAETEMFNEEGPDSYMRVPGFEGLEIRLLPHIEKYTNGQWGGVIMRSLPGLEFTGSSWHMHQLDAQYSFVAKGWAVVELEGLPPVRIEAGSSIVQPAMNRHRLLALSDDFVAMELSSPANFSTTAWVWDEQAQEYMTITVDGVDLEAAAKM